MPAYDVLRFKLFGITTPGTTDSVDARVFSEKLSILLAALTTADRAANGKSMYNHTIIKAEIGSLDIHIQEYLKPRYRKRPNESSIYALGSCLEAITSGRYDKATSYGRCSRLIGRLGHGAGRRFAHGELWAKASIPFRIDDVLSAQAEPLCTDDEQVSEGFARYYRGFSHSSFDGMLKEVDFRGTLPQGKFILTAGEKEIDCIFSGVEQADILDAVKQRTRIYGTAFFDGRSGLPRRLTISKAPRHIRQNVDFTKWRATFKPFETASWEEEVG